MKRTRLLGPPLYALMVACAATVVIVEVDGWRTAALALVAGGAVLATRLRFACSAAAVLLAATALLVSGGNGIA